MSTTGSAQPPSVSSEARASEEDVEAARVRGVAISPATGAWAVKAASSAARITARSIAPSTRPPSTTARASSPASAKKRARAWAIVALASTGSGRSAQCAILVIEQDALAIWVVRLTAVEFLNR